MELNLIFQSNLFIASITLLFLLTILKININIKVNKRSVKITKLKELNKNFSDKFIKIHNQIVLNETFSNKATYDNLNGEKVLKKVIDSFIINLEKFGNEIEGTKINIRLWDKYKFEFKEILLSESIFQKKSYIRSERRKIIRKKLKPPQMEITLKYSAEYTSRKGRNSYNWVWEYSYQDVLTTYEDALNEIEFRKSKEHFKKIQRNKINDNIRFEVFKRDNYRCNICGVSPNEDGEITLHLDHIIPIAKGGDSDLNNLQTLCSRCNMGKKAKLM